MITGKKTKIGVVLIFVAAVLYLFYAALAVSLFMIGTGICFFGIYDKGGRDKGETIVEIAASKIAPEDILDTIATKYKVIRRMIS